MANNAAQDEFDALAATQKSKLSRHRDDASSSDDAAADSDLETTTRYGQSRPSLRAGGGRSNTANKDEDSENDDDDDDWDERYGAANAAIGKNSKDPGYSIPTGDIGRQGNTGPKGVIADARAAEREKNEQRRVIAAAAKNRGGASRINGGSGEVEGRKWYEDGEEPEDDGEDEDFMEQWRRKRIDELEAAKKNGTIGANVHGPPAHRGKLQLVDAMGYLDAIEEAPKGMVVVVFISDEEVDFPQWKREESSANRPKSPISKTYESHLSTIASKYSNVRFVALSYEEAEFEHAGVPALLAYRDGNKFADMVPIRDEVPITCNVVTNLEEALKG
jgi:hypothetical protein